MQTTATLSSSEAVQLTGLMDDGLPACGIVCCGVSGAHLSSQVKQLAQSRHRRVEPHHEVGGRLLSPAVPCQALVRHHDLHNFCS